MLKKSKVSNRTLWDYCILYSLPFLYFRGFEFIGFDMATLKLCLFISVLLLFIYVVRVVVCTKDDVSKYAKYILCMFFISCVMALGFHNQKIDQSYRTCINFAFILFYFYLVRRKFTVREMQHLVVFYGVLWVILWLIAQYYAPIRLFGNPEEAINEQRGISRFLIPGDCFLYMFYFLMLTKWLNRKSIFSFLCAVALFAVIFLQVTRQTIIVTTIVTIYYLFKRKEYKYLAILTVFCVGIIYNTGIHDNTILAQMMSLSKEQIEDIRIYQEGSRINSAAYFIKEMPNSLPTIILGNGFPHADSEWGKSFVNLKDYGIYLSDVGYPAVFVIFGLFGIAVFFKLLYYILKHRFSEQAQYAVLFLLYILLCNFMSFVINVSMVAICVSLYLLYLSNQEMSKRTRIESNS